MSGRLHGNHHHEECCDVTHPPLLAVAVAVMADLDYALFMLSDGLQER